MKKTQLLITAMLVCSIFANAQNDKMYVIKGNTAVEYAVSDIDSIIFYEPTVTPPVSDVPFFNGTLTRESQGDEPRSDWSSGPQQYTPWETRGKNGVMAKYYYNSPANNGVVVGLYVLFPPSYDTEPNRKYPVIYHLHGKGEKETNQDSGTYQVNAWNAMNTGGVSEFIYISVGGPGSCWWSDTVDGTVKAESHIVNEILSLVDQTFRTLPARESRAITGFSMGGYGATKIGFKYPQYFSAVGSFCGATYSYPGGDDSQLMTGNFGFSADYNAIWNGNVEEYKLDNARYYVNTKANEIKSYGMAILLRPGSSDGYKVFSEGLKTDLDANNIAHTFTWYNGGHSLSSINAESFAFLLSNMITQ